MGLAPTNAGRTVHISEIIHHELTHIPPPLAKPIGEMNSTSKSDMVAGLTAGVLIDGHAMIQTH